MYIESIEKLLYSKEEDLPPESENNEELDENDRLS